MTKANKKTSKKKSKSNEKETPPVVEQDSESAPESSGFSFDSLSDVHDQIQDESPEPNQAAIDAQSDATVEKAKETAGNVDSTGTVFNPELHAVSADGTPSKTPTGKWRKKRGASKVSTSNAALAAQADEQKRKEAARAAGQLAADMMIGSSVMLLGDEWAPIGGDGNQEPIQFDEHSNMRRAFADYFEAKGISDFPPGIALSIAITSYAMPRLVGGEQTKTKLSKAKDWITSKYFAMKAKRKPKNAAQSNRGNDGKRENDVGKETGSTEQSTGQRHSRS